MCTLCNVYYCYSLCVRSSGGQGFSVWWLPAETRRTASSSNKLKVSTQPCGHLHAEKAWKNEISSAPGAEVVRRKEALLCTPRTKYMHRSMFALNFYIYLISFFWYRHWVLPNMLFFKFLFTKNSHRIIKR